MTSETHIQDVSPRSLEIIQRTLGNILSKIDEGDSFILKFPPLRDHVMEVPGFHFHFNPEFIIGIQGTNRFQFINEELVIKPQEMALIPAGIPHRDLSYELKSTPLQNLIIGLYNQTVHMELQTRHLPNAALQVDKLFLDSPKYSLIETYLNEMTDCHFTYEKKGNLIIKGLLLTYFETLKIIIQQQKQDVDENKKLKISQIKNLVQENLGSPELSLKLLSKILHCSADYLSHFFHRKTHEHLVTYINRQRIEAAMELIKSTPLTIAEIAFKTGFENPAYFSKVFKQLTFKTPQSFRLHTEHSYIELEGRPHKITSHVGEGYFPPQAS